MEVCGGVLWDGSGLDLAQVGCSVGCADHTRRNGSFSVFIVTSHPHSLLKLRAQSTESGEREREKQRGKVWL